MEARAGAPRERQRICSAALAYSTWTRCANGLDLAQVGVVGRTRDATSTFTRVSLMRTYLAFTAALLALPACSSDTLHPAAPQNVAPVFCATSGMIATSAMTTMIEEPKAQERSTRSAISPLATGCLPFVEAQTVSSRRRATSQREVLAAAVDSEIRACSRSRGT